MSFATRLSPRPRDVARAVGRLGAVSPVTAPMPVDRIDERVGGFDSDAPDERIAPVTQSVLWRRRQRARADAIGPVAPVADPAPVTRAMPRADLVLADEPVAITLARLVNSPHGGEELRRRIRRIWRECDLSLPPTGARGYGDPVRRHLIGAAAARVSMLQAVWELGRALTHGAAPVGMPATEGAEPDADDLAAHGVYLILTIVQHGDRERCEAAVASLEPSLGRPLARHRVREAIDSLPEDFWRDVHGSGTDDVLATVREALAPDSVARTPSRNERLLRAWLAGRTR